MRSKPRPHPMESPTSRTVQDLVPGGEVVVVDDDVLVDVVLVGSEVVVVA